MTKVGQASSLLAVAAELLRENSGRLPAGTLDDAASLLESHETGTTTRRGRTKYRRGTLADLLDQLSERLSDD